MDPISYFHRFGIFPAPEDEPIQPVIEDEPILPVEELPVVQKAKKIGAVAGPIAFSCGLIAGAAAFLLLKPGPKADAITIPVGPCPVPLLCREPFVLPPFIKPLNTTQLKPVLEIIESELPCEPDPIKPAAVIEQELPCEPDPIPTPPLSPAVKQPKPIINPEPIVFDDEEDEHVPTLAEINAFMSVHHRNTSTEQQSAPQPKRGASMGALAALASLAVMLVSCCLRRCKRRDDAMLMTTMTYVHDPEKKDEKKGSEPVLVHAENPKPKEKPLPLSDKKEGKWPAAAAMPPAEVLDPIDEEVDLLDAQLAYTSTQPMSKEHLRLLRQFMAGKR